ncbi:hypothetical protein [Parageobacillus thermoglucosidasius]|uniref:Uncharacterized protein n=1 Tax=Parageobacillus thermoglucosidasius TaxID=1426 RepID=A0AB38R481_PARTM|nr:hypothetical protein [Parageobacillus thermoglucosidasius]UOE78408.1 hypothetical protein IMI45_20130 [Parageobacillus thermoglucosidasius]
MKILVSFVLRKGQIERFNKVIPEHLRTRLLRKFILNEYELPKDESELVSLFLEPEESEVYPFRLSEEVLERLDILVDKVNNYGEKLASQKTTNRSSIMRNIMDRIIEKYEKNPVSERKWKMKPVHVTKEQKELLQKYIDQREISAVLEDFILEEYKGPSVSVQELKRRPKEKMEILVITISDDATEYLKKIISQYRAEDKVKMAHILRDAINQLIKKLENENPQKKALELRLKHTIEELMQYSTIEEVQELLENYNTKEE